MLRLNLLGIIFFSMLLGAKTCNHIEAYLFKNGIEENGGSLVITKAPYAESYVCKKLTSDK